MQLDFSFSNPSPQKKSRDQPPEVLTVGELTAKIRGVLEKEIRTVWVRGEVSNHRRQSSGHQYFTLKDADAQIACVLFAGDARLLRGVTIADGQEVQLTGELSVYSSRGQYQIVVKFVQPTGAGVLQAKFEALKQKLQAEGLFDPAKKKALPAHPVRVGVITSPTGAALRDFLQVLWRRSPGMRVLLFPVRVQGAGAAAEIASAVRAAQSLPPESRPEILVLTRGGGSIEDLWEFNDESLAREIAACFLPVVSAVGHEIDFTICDFVADLRAPTPSAAAEIISRESAELRKHLALTALRMRRCCDTALRAAGLSLARILASRLFRRPESLSHEFRQRLDDLSASLQTATDRQLEQKSARLQRSLVVLQSRSPVRWLDAKKAALLAHRHRLIPLMQSAVAETSARLKKASHVLRALNPETTLARGFTLTLNEGGGLVTSTKQASPGTRIRTRFHDGEIVSTVDPPGRKNSRKED